jgi:hypothetical protein
VVTELQPTAADTGQAERRFGGDTLFLGYAYQSRKWYANARHSRIDDAIRTGTEFSRQVGRDRSEFELGRSWTGHGSDWWKKKTLRTIYEFSQNNDGQVLADRYITEIGIVGVNQSKVQLQFHNGREFQAGRLVDFDQFVLTGSIRPHKDLEVGIETRVGDKMDFVNAQLAEQRRVRPFLHWNVNDRLEIQLNRTHVGLDSMEGQEILDASLVNAHLTWSFDARGSVRLSMRQRDVERNPDAYVKSVDKRTKDTGRQLLYSWRLNPQTVFNLGYSDAHNGDIELGSFRPVDGNWFMKVGYTLIF